jgi:uncharacterized protein (DUF1015 family)
MVKIYRFAAVRPEKKVASRIAAVPYDVVTTEEAQECISKNSMSFLSISRSDALLPDLPPNDDRVYQLSREKFDALIADGLMSQDGLPGMYIYRVVAGPDTYLGLCCCMDVRDYETNVIRRHELTRYDKEEDRTRHIDAVNANTGPVVLLYRDSGSIFPFIESLVRNADAPDTEVAWDNGEIHQVYYIRDASDLAHLENLFSPVERLYIADGHHRAKSAVNVAEKRRKAGTLTEEATHFMGVLFAHKRVRIHGYSRLVTDLGGMSPREFMDAMSAFFTISPYGPVDNGGYHIPPHTPSIPQSHVVHMYLGGVWYECFAPVDATLDPIKSLDVSVLQKEILEKILGITDPRADIRLQYLGGARPVSDLEEMVDRGDFVVAFSMQPVKVESVLDIADAGGIMPPKSTWFEPKLLSGLAVHRLE